MSPEHSASPGLVFLDACCVINLFAAGRSEEILRDLPYRFAIARYVAENEVLEIGGEGDEHIGLRPRIETLVKKEILQEFSISSTEEHRQLVRFALDLDDGEAHTCALALVRGARVATDDKKAIRVLHKAWRDENGPRSAFNPCIRTSELLFEWAAEMVIEDAEVARIVRSVARCASFIPPRADPNVDRWMTLLGGC